MEQQLRDDFIADEETLRNFQFLVRSLSDEQRQIISDTMQEMSFYSDQNMIVKGTAEEPEFNAEILQKLEEAVGQVTSTFTPEQREAMDGMMGAVEKLGMPDAPHADTMNKFTLLFAMDSSMDLLRKEYTVELSTNSPVVNENIEMNENLIEDRLTKFVDGLTPEQKEMFVDPRNEPAMFGKSPCSPGEMCGWYDVQPEVHSEWMEEYHKFIESLSPDQLKELQSISDDAEKLGVEFLSPDPALRQPNIDLPLLLTGIESLPDQISPDAPVTVTDSPAVTADDVTRIQEYLNTLRDCGVEGIDIGHYGANGDGVDGIKGPMTDGSIIAAKQALGIEPATAEITPDLAEQFQDAALAKVLEQQGPVYAMQGDASFVPGQQQSVAIDGSLPGLQQQSSQGFGFGNKV